MLKQRQWEICQTLSYFLVRIEICDTFCRLFTMLKVEFGFPINNRGVDSFFINFQIASRTYSISTSIVQDVIFSLSLVTLFIFC